MLEEKTVSSDLFQNLSQEEKNILEKIRSSCQSDGDCLGRVCRFLYDKIGKNRATHFQKLSPETKLQACLEHIVIGLKSGDIKKREIEKVIK